VGLDVSGLQLGGVHADGVRSAGKDGASLGRDALALLVRFGLELIVGLDSLEELVSAAGLPEMLRADVESLLNLPVSDDLVDDDADGSGVDVEYLGSTAVVDLVGHALVDGTIDLDIDELAALEGGEVVGHLNGTVLAEGLGEFRTSSGSVSLRIGHSL
jgi:hypothetical protein